MSSHPHWAVKLYEKLPARTWAWIILAFSQDQALWSSLQDEDLFKHAIQVVSENPQNLTPARLGLLDARTNIDVNTLKSLPLSKLPAKIRYQLGSFDLNAGTTTVPGSRILKKALFLAYKINERSKSAELGPWLEDKVLQLLQSSKLVLACLLELVSDPLGLLQYILARTQKPGEFDSILQAYLCLPQEPEEQLRSFRYILQGLPDQKKIETIRSLARLRPGLAVQVSRDVKDSIDTHSLTPEDSLFGSANSKNIEADLNQLSDYPNETADSLRETIELVNRLQGHLLAKLAQQLSTTGADPKKSLDLWKQALRANPQEPDFLVGILKHLIATNRIEEAEAWIASFRGDSSHPKVLLQTAKIASIKSCPVTCRQLAQDALIKSLNDPTEFDADYFLELSLLLDQLGNSQEALKVFDLLQTLNALDADILGHKAMVQSKTASPRDAMDTAILAYAAYILSEKKNQKSIPIQDHQLIFIKALERGEEWGHAFKERSTWMDMHLEPSATELAAYAKCAINANQAGISLNLLNRAKDLGNDSEDIDELLGLTHLKLGNISKAIQIFEKTSLLAPFRPSSWLNLAEAYLKNNQPDRVIETLRSGTLSVPDSTEILLKLGEFSILNNAPSQAIAPLQKAANLVGLDCSQSQRKSPGPFECKQDPHLPEIAVLLANAFRSVGKTSEGLQVLEKSIQQVHGGIQEQPALFAAYAESLHDAGENEFAIPIMELLLEANPDSLEYRLLLCRALLSIPDQKAGAMQALPLLSTILENSENQNQINLAETYLADALLQVGNFEAAKNYYQKSLQSSISKNPEWRQKLTFGLGRVNFSLNEIEAALAAFQEAIRSHTPTPEITRWLAEAYLAVHLYDEAFRTAQQVLQQAPASVETIEWFTGLAIRIVSQYPVNQEQILQEAIRILLRFLQNGVEKPGLWLRLGELHTLKDDTQAAFAAFGRILDLPAVSVPEQFTKLSHLFTAGNLLLGKKAYYESIVFLEPAALISAEVNVNKPPSEILDASDIQPVEILNQLEIAYRETGNLQPSITILRKIISFDPQNPEPYIRLSERLFTLGLVQEAISCLVTAIELQPENLDLYNYLIWIHSMTGDYVSALGMAKEAHQKAEIRQNLDAQHIYCYLAAEIARSIFAIDIALKLLTYDVTNPTDDVELLLSILKIELTLESSRESPSLADLTALESFHVHHPRFLALKARIRPGLVTPVQLDILTAEFRQNSTKAAIGNQYGEVFAYWSGIALNRSLAEAALCLGDWQASINQFENLLASSQNEPFTNFQFARALVIRAEEQRYDELVDIVQRAPGEIALREETYHLFLTTIDKALRRLSDVSADLQPEPLEQNWNEKAQSDILNWRDRGILAFRPSEQIIAAYSAKAKTNEEIKALWLASTLIPQGEASKYTLPNAAQEPFLRIILCLVQEQNKPWEALETICRAYEQAADPSSENQVFLPVIYYLLSRLSMRTGGQNRLGISPIDSLERALQVYPDEPRWHAFLANLLMATGEPEPESNKIERARQQLEIAISLEPGYAPHKFDLGRILLYQGQISNAADCFTDACHLNPKLGEAWFELAKIQFLDGLLEEAANAATQAIENLPDPIEALVLRGKIALASGNPRGAQSRAQNAINLNPNHLEALQLLARALNALDQSDEAIEILAKVIPQVEKPLPLELERSRWLSEAAPTPEAAYELRALAQRYPQEPLFKALLAGILIKLGQVEPAILSARQALQDADLGLPDKEQSSLYLLLGRHYRDSGQLDSAIHHLDQAIGLDPTNLEAHLELGRTHQDRRQYALAVSAYQGAMQVAASDYRPYYMAGLALKEAKEYQAAEEMLQKAVEKTPDNPIVHRQLGAVIALNLVHNRRSTSFPVKAS